MNVLFAASEATPFCKTGGLADVIGSLPHALRHCGVDARVILPRYRDLQTEDFEIETVAELSIFFDGVLQRATLQRAVSTQNSKLKTQNYFLDAPQYFNRAQLYDYDDDVFRFGFFCRAVLESLPILKECDNFAPDILHGHDWHCGLLPAYAQTFSNKNFKTIFTIHNLAYQGIAPKEFLPRLGLDWSLFNYHQLEFYDQINSLKAGLVFSDAITTVSPTYAREIQTPQFGAGLEGVLAERAHQLHGILNGIDYAKWNPQTDEFLAANYDGENCEGKQECKRDLLHAVGWSQAGSTPGMETPVIGIVSRLSAQKGFDLIAAALPDLLALDCRLVILGAGDEYYMTLLRNLGKRFSARAAFEIGEYNESLAHKIYAGSDLFLMPSHYEPCGLSQMIALAYGTIPIVRATGGLADTIEHFDARTGNGNGFIFHAYNTQAMRNAIREAIECYRSPHWNTLVRNAFACDFSWDASAQKYAALYGRMTEF
jgi:starch synthase